MVAKTPSILPLRLVRATAPLPGALTQTRPRSGKPGRRLHFAQWLMQIKPTPTLHLGQMLMQIKPIRQGLRILPGEHPSKRFRPIARRSHPPLS
jgi:hypothetical protein